MKPVLEVRFFRTDAGAEPVRDWLEELPATERKAVGEDIKTVQFGGLSECHWWITWPATFGK